MDTINSVIAALDNALAAEERLFVAQHLMNLLTTVRQHRRKQHL